MPAAPIVIGQEFQGPSVRNWDDTTIETWVTVTAGTPASPGRFTVRWLNSSPVAAALVLRRTGSADVTVSLPSGAGSASAGNRTWRDWRTVQLASIAPGG